MQDACRTGAVIAAAGMSSRMGDFKPLLRLGSMTFTKRIISSFRQAGISPLVLVTGYRADDLEKHVAGEGVMCIRNERYEATEMIDSVRIGLRYIEGRCTRAFICPVDVPLFRTRTVLQMLGAKGSVIKPAFRGRAGHPVLISQSVFRDVLDAGADTGLGEILAGLRSRTHYEDVEDEGVLYDADTPGDYEDLLACHNRQLFRPEVTVSLAAQQPLLTRETAELLQVLRYDGTVKSACSRLHISYRKAWNMITEAERHLGIRLVDRTAGGEYGGGSSLTAGAADLLNRYDAFTREVQSFANERFGTFFSDWPDHPAT